VHKINCWDDLRPFGIDALTGEACGLSYHLLCDVTQKGKRTIEKALGAAELVLPDASTEIAGRPVRRELVLSSRTRALLKRHGVEFDEFTQGGASLCPGLTCCGPFGARKRMTCPPGDAPSGRWNVNTAS
jgi:hypothetical protein